MPSIPIDVLQEILGHVDKNDLVALCRVNKIFCSCSRDVLYREVYGNSRVIQTLAQSTDLARRVRRFSISHEWPELATALRNMSSLRRLYLSNISGDASILDGCTFKLYSFTSSFPYTKPLQQFLNNQSSITHVTFLWGNEPIPSFDERCLPNLTRVKAYPSWLRILIPGRPVREVFMLSPSSIGPTDLSFFALSTTPIQKLSIHYAMLYPKPVSLLVSIFPSLVYLEVNAYAVDWTVRVLLCLSI
jgi:hypothetical protein